MKTRFLLVILLLLFTGQKNLNAQSPLTNKYIFYMFGSCDASVDIDVYNAAGTTLLCSLKNVTNPLNKQYMENSDCDSQSEFTVIYKSTYGCSRFPAGETEVIRNAIMSNSHNEVSDYLGFYWSPVTTGLSFSIGSVGVVTTGLSSNPLDKNTDHLMNITIVSAYTGNDVQWVLNTSNGIINTGKTGRTLLIDGKEITQLLGGFNIPFQIVPRLPHYELVSSSFPYEVTKGYRDSYYRTQTLRIVPRTLNTSNPDDCNGTVSISPVGFNLYNVAEVNIQVGYNGNYKNLNRFKNINLYQNTGFNITADDIFSLFPDNNIFTFRMVYSSDNYIVYAILNTPVTLYPPLTDFTVKAVGYLPENPGTGKIIIKRDDATYNERFEASIDEYTQGSVNLNSGIFTDTIKNLNTGNYTVDFKRIDNGNHCNSPEKSCTISIIFKPTISNVKPTSVSCPGRSDGKLSFSYINPNKTSNITISTDCEGARRNYSLTNALPSGSYTTSNNLPAGTYTVWMTDGLNVVSDIDTAVLPAPPPVTFDLEGVQPDCYGSSTVGGINVKNIAGGSTFHNDMIAIYLNGGSNPYLWVNANTVNTSIGSNFNISTTYSVAVEKTAIGPEAPCRSSTKTITIGQPPRLQLATPAYTLSNFNGYNIQCNGSNNGQITVNNTGGTGTITRRLQWNGYDQTNTTGIFENLGPGSAMATINLTDSNGCTYNNNALQITLTQPMPVSISSAGSVQENCVGTEDGSINVNVVSPRTVQSYSWQNSLGQVVGSAKDLVNQGAGAYSLLVTDIAGCKGLASNLTISRKAPITYTSAKNNPSCIGYNDGSVNISAITGGTSPYTYTLNNGSPGNAGTGVNFNNLGKGNYSVSIRDANYQSIGKYSSCISNSTFEIMDKTLATVNATETDPLCFGDNSGQIAATSFSGPDNPYLYAWLTSDSVWVGSGNNLLNAPAGNYWAYISDSRNCHIIQKGFSLSDPPKLVFNDIMVDSAACNEVSNGSITISALGGINPLRFSINGGSTYSFAGLFSGMASGIYPLRVADAHNCYIDTSAVIGAGEVNLQYLNKQDVSCFGNSNGMLQYTASGSTSGNYQYYISSGSLNRNNSIGLFNALPSGLYRASVQDDIGCKSDTLIHTLLQPDNLTIFLTLIDSSACLQPNGSIGYNINGGNGYYKNVWSKAGTGVIPVFNPNSLSTGNYTLNVTDTLGCAASGSIFVPDRPAPAIIGFNILSLPYCGMSLGSISTNITSGSPPFRIGWNTSVTDTLATITDIGAGTYRINVTDRYNCIAQGETDLNEAPQMSLSTSVTSAHCGHKDGSVSLSVQDGSAPYQFIWPDSIASGPVSSSIMENLYSADYDVYVVDATGCQKLFIVSVDDLNGPSIEYVDNTKAWCGLPTGTSRIAASGGNPPYQYSWLDGSLVISSDTNYLENIYAGNYTVHVTDQDNCIKSMNIEIEDSIELQPSINLISIDSAACNKPLGGISVEMYNGSPPYTYIWNTGDSQSGLKNITRGVYRVTGTDQLGCNDSLVVTVPDKKTPKLNLVSASPSYCGFANGELTVSAHYGTPPYYIHLVSGPKDSTVAEFIDSLGLYHATIDGLTSSTGLYHVILSDSNGCTSNEVATYITDNNPLVIYLEDVRPVSCDGGSDGMAMVSVANGIAPYSYQWDPVGSGSAVNSSLPAGPFSVTVTDAAGCSKTANYSSMPVTQPAPLTLTSFVKNNPLCHDYCNGSIAALAAGGNKTKYVYVWNNSDTTQSATGLCAGNHSLKVIDAKGCTFSRSFLLQNPSEIKVTQLPEEVTICTGSVYVASVDDDLININWDSDNGFHSNEQIIALSKQGVYYLKASSAEGCLLNDSVHLYVSENLLNAEFLMMSQTFVGDTIAIIEVSWPMANECAWEMPDETQVVTDIDNYKEIVFNEPGKYYIELEASLAGCSSVLGKYIEVLEPVAPEISEKSMHIESLISVFELFPNPASNNLNLKVELSDEADIRVELLNVNGTKMEFMANEHGMANYNIPVEVSDLLPGVYFVRLIAKNEVKTKILVVR